MAIFIIQQCSLVHPKYHKNQQLATAGAELISHQTVGYNAVKHSITVRTLLGIITYNYCERKP